MSYASHSLIALVEYNDHLAVLLYLKLPFELRSYYYPTTLIDTTTTQLGTTHQTQRDVAPTYNPGHNILELYNILVQIRFASERELII